MSGLLTVSYFLLNLFFGLAIFLLWARLTLRYFRISSLHPISQFVYNATNAIIAPLSRKVVKPRAPLNRYDWPCFTILVIIELLKFILIGLLLFGGIMSWEFLLLYIAADLIVQPLNLLFYAILIRVIMSWVNPLWHHPVADILRIVTEPILRLCRRPLPDKAGFDFSPIIALIILEVITLFISASLPVKII